MMLFVCGAVDNISVVVRHTLVQLLTPDEKRGRVSAVNSLFIGTSNELGGFESGFVAHLFGPVVSVVSGGSEPSWSSLPLAGSGRNSQVWPPGVAARWLREAGTTQTSSESHAL